MILRPQHFLKFPSLNASLLALSYDRRFGSQPKGRTVQSDAEIVAEVRAGNVGWYAVLVRRYERLVRATVLRKVTDQHCTDDVVQDAFLIAYETLSSLRDADRFGPWLMGIAKNRAMRTIRERSRSAHAVADVDLLPFETTGVLSEQSRELLELVERLPDHERIVIGLKYFEGHTAVEISAIIGRPVGTVTKQLSRAHARLGRWLTQEARR
jgi:RNA polymerase sigma-70 factor (ECF subfamily)